VTCLRAFAGPILALTLVAAAPVATTFNGIPFGKSEVISGVWFTNFENSRFLKCSGSDCDNLPLSEWAAIQGLPGICADLDVKARAASHQWNLNEAPDGGFNVRFVGRMGLQTYPSRYIGDGQHRVLIERILEVKKRAD